MPFLFRSISFPPPPRWTSSILYGDVAPNAKLFVRRWLLPVKIDGRRGRGRKRKRERERTEWIEERMESNEARMSLYAVARGSAGTIRRRCFRTSVRFILLVESSRGSLDKGQLFGGGKDSWSNRPQRERRDAMGRSGYFPPTAHRLKIESPPSYGKDYLNLRSAPTMRMPPHLSSLLPHGSCPRCQSRVPWNTITKGFDDDYGREEAYVRGVYKYRSEADIYPATLLCSRVYVCVYVYVCVNAIKERIKLDALKDAKGTML